MLLVIAILILVVLFTTSLSLPLIFAVGCIIGIFVFCNRSKENYVKFNDDKIRQLQAKLLQCFPESAQITVSGSDKSFTVDKKHVYLCIKDEKGNYYDDNSLMHVLLHEYAHVLCDEIDEGEHKDKFKRIFAGLMDKAVTCGVYDSSIPMVEKYCGY